MSYINILKFSTVSWLGWSTFTTIHWQSRWHHCNTRYHNRFMALFLFLPRDFLLLVYLMNLITISVYNSRGLEFCYRLVEQDANSNLLWRIGSQWGRTERKNPSFGKQNLIYFRQFSLFPFSGFQFQHISHSCYEHWEIWDCMFIFAIVISRSFS